MKKDPIVFIEHILECIELIEEYTRGVTKEEFFKSKQLQDSVIRRIEVIGEATKNISQEIKDKYFQIPWKRISGMRDILIHEYWGIDLNLTWNIATQEMQNFKKSILEIKKDLKAKDD